MKVVKFNNYNVNEENVKSIVTRVKAFIINDKNEVMLGHSKDCVQLPGGHRENDEEVEFKFKAADIEIVAELMKAKTFGSSISPFSTKNLPKSDVKIPTEEIARYKEITNVIPKTDLLFISRTTNEFLDNILQKGLRKTTKDKKYDYKSDMKKLKMARQVKEFIWIKNFWEEYLDYLEKEITKIYN